jgi:glycosyltransferase involved in cell wall biosynthesis
MSNHPTVSVIIPTFNCGEYLNGAIQSAVNQVDVSVQVIVVDDCSTDGTRERFEGDSRIVYCRNDVNQGVSQSRNTGMRLATGRYIAFLDADDEWLTHKCRLQCDLLDGDPSLLAVGGKMIHMEAEYQLPENDAATLQRFTFPEMLMRNRLATPTVMARRAALEQLGGFDTGLDICEDYDLWLRLSRLGSVGRTTSVVARYRTRPQGISAGNRDRTHFLHCKYVNSFPLRFRSVHRIRALMRIHLSTAYLDRSISCVDEQGNCFAGLAAIGRSLWYWPLPLPTASLRWLRARRLLCTTRKLICG